MSLQVIVVGNYSLHDSQPTYKSVKYYNIIQQFEYYDYNIIDVQ